MVVVSFGYLKDLFDNQLSGTLPETLSNLDALQILHVKLNSLTGTISSQLGTLPYLSWFDVSGNRLHGTIPSTFGTSSSLKDFRLGGNMIYEPIPQSLCTNVNINGGLTRNYGCDGVIWSLGYVFRSWTCYTFSWLYTVSRWTKQHVLRKFLV